MSEILPCPPQREEDDSIKRLSVIYENAPQGPDNDNKTPAGVDTYLKKGLWDAMDASGLYTNIITQRDFERIVLDLFNAYPAVFRTGNRSAILAITYEYLKSRCAHPRYVDLIVALLDNLLSRLDRLMDFRKHTVEIFKSDVEALNRELVEAAGSKELGPRELIDEVRIIRTDLAEARTRLNILRHGSLSRIQEVLSDLSDFPEKVLEHDISPFEEAYIQSEYEARAAYWDLFREKVAVLFHLDEDEVASADEARAGNGEAAQAVGNLVKTLESDLIQQIEESTVAANKDEMVEEEGINGKKRPYIKPVAIEVQPSLTLENGQPFNVTPIYQQWNGNYDELDLIRKWQPKVVTPGPGKIDSDMANWFLVMVGLAPRAKRANMRRLIAYTLDYEVSQIASLTSCLMGVHRQNIFEGSIRHEVVTDIENLLARKKQEEEADKTADDEEKADDIDDTEETHDEVDVDDDQETDVDNDALEMETGDIEVMDEPYEDDPNYDNEGKRQGWRIPEARLIRRTWGRINPLKDKRMLILETPQLLEWQMLERMGGQEQNLTIVERDQEKAERLRELLPRAEVAHAELDEWLVALARDRLLDNPKEIQRHKLRLAELKDAKEIVFNPSQQKKMKAPPHFFNWLRDDEALEQLGLERFKKALRDFTKSPYIYRPNLVEFPQRPHEAFDFVSLDTKSKFGTFSGTLTLLIRLGLLKDTSALCTNFLGQREGMMSKALYTRAFLNRQTFWGEDFSSTLSSMDDSLKEMRNGISVGILDALYTGAHTPFSHPDSPICKALTKDMIWDPDIAKATIQRLLKGYGILDENGVVREEWGSEELVSLITHEMHLYLANVNYHRRCQETFLPLARKLGARNRRKLESIRTPDIGFPMPPGKEIYPEEAWISWDEMYGRMLANVIYSHWAHALDVTHHEARLYRGARMSMVSDFFRVQRENESLKLSGEMLDMLTEAVVIKQPPDIRARRLMKAIMKTVKLHHRQHHLRGNIARQQV